MAAAITDERVVSCAIFNPCKSVFKDLRRDRAECTLVSCTLESCPLRDAKTCALASPIAWDACPYGRVRTETGYTSKARRFSRWISDRQERHAGIPALQIPARKMAFVGDYVYLPYAHMTMHDSVPFLVHGGWAKGNSFLPRQAWTLETVLQLLDFRPQALMGGEIKGYQADSVPKFLVHLRETDSGMWDALVAVRPGLNSPANHVGRKAVLATLSHPIEWTTDKSYPVTWQWDGKVLRTPSLHAYDSTWGAVKLQQVSIEGTPAEDATVIVRDNAWVNEETVFED